MNKFLIAILLLFLIAPSLVEARGARQARVWEFDGAPSTSDRDARYRVGDRGIDTSSNNEYVYTATGNWEQTDAAATTSTVFHGVTTYGHTDATAVSGASNLFITLIRGTTSGTTVESDGAGGVSVWITAPIALSGTQGQIAIMDADGLSVQGDGQFVISGNSIYGVDTSGQTVFHIGGGTGSVSGVSLWQLCLALPALKAAPDDPVTGQFYRVDVTQWDPAGISGSTNYTVMYSGGGWVTMWDDDGDWLPSGIATPTLSQSELEDTSTPHVLVLSEVQNKKLLNASGTTAAWVLPSASGASTAYFEAMSWSSSHTHGGISIYPNTDEYICLNATNLTKGRGFVNAAASEGEYVVCRSYGGVTWYCESEYADFKEDVN